MSNKTILVTGSAGMIGCYLVKDLIAKGCTVVGVDRRVSDWTHEHLKQVVLDLADKNALEALLDAEKVDRCIHLAALAHAGGGETDFSFERFKFLNVTCGCHWHGEGVNKFRHRAESYLELWKEQGNG